MWSVDCLNNGDGPKAKKHPWSTAHAIPKTSGMVGKIRVSTPLLAMPNQTENLWKMKQTFFLPNNFPHFTILKIEMIAAAIYMM